jgi:hypothetical protein
MTKSSKTLLLFNRREKYLKAIQSVLQQLAALRTINPL